MTELQAAHPLPGRSHTASEATKPPARRLSAAVPAATHCTPHPNTSMRHRSRPPLRPEPTPQPSPPQKLSGEASAVPIAPVVPGSQLQPALSDSARDAVMAKKRHNLRTRGSRFQLQLSPGTAYTTRPPPPWGSLTPAPAAGADAGRLWHGGHPDRGRHSGGDPPQTAPTAPSAPRQTDAEDAAPLAAGPWCPMPNAPPKAGEASPYTPLLGCYPGWQRAGSLRRWRRAPPKAAQTAVSPEKKPGSIHEAPLPTPKASLSSPRMQPTACLDPRSARRRAKRGARRGARTAHRL